jgi:integrase
VILNGRLQRLSRSFGTLPIASGLQCQSTKTKEEDASMGSIYRPKWKAADGTIKETPIWWIKYYKDGKPIRESTESDKESVAKTLLKAREGDIVKGLPVLPRVDRVRFEELVEDLLNEYRNNHRKSLDDTERRFKLHLTPFFDGRRAAAITTSDVRKFIVSRQTAGASNGEINRELSGLKRAFNLAVQDRKLLTKPYIPMLKESAPRSGFFEADQLQAVLTHLPDPLQPLIRFLYITGWRSVSEALPLQWRHVDFAGGCVRLDPGTTKNGDGRVFPFTAELKTLLEAQKASVDALREKNVICPWVFHREGEPIRSFKKAFKSACKQAGLAGRIPHDFRRTAVRNLVRAGIRESVAMQLTGHKTRSIFDRYNITSGSDLAEAAKLLDLATGTNPGTNRKNRRIQTRRRKSATLQLIES